MPIGPGQAIDPKTGALTDVSRDASGAPIWPEISRAERIGLDAGLSSKTATFSENQAEAMRDDMVKAALDRFTAKRPGATAAEIAEAKAAARAQWDEAAERDGFEVVAPEEELSPEDAANISRAGVAASAAEIAAAVSNASLNSRDAIAPDTQIGTSQWGVDMGFGRETAVAVISTLNSEAQRFKALATPEARRAQLEAYQAMGTKLWGLDGYKELRSRALATLKGDEISQGLKTHPVLSYSPQILSLLDHHAKSLDWVINRGRRR
jgi:hypothetical protein